MEVVKIIVLVAFLFFSGRLLLYILQKRVSAEEARFIQKKYFGWIFVSLFFVFLIILPRGISKVEYFILTCIGYWQVATTVKEKINRAPLKIFVLTSILLASTMAFFYINIGTKYLFAVILGSVFSDISAYSFSKLSKNKHFLPQYINKNKTLEGIVGGAFGPFAILPLLLVMGYNFKLSNALILVAVIGISSNLGDLLNSIIKRLLAIKDWGETFPGHGGIFDRFISFYMSYTVVSILFIQSLL